MKIYENEQPIAVYFSNLLDNHVFLFHSHYSSQEGLKSYNKISRNLIPFINN